MIHVEIIVGCIAFGVLYTLIFERYKGKHFETKKRPDGSLNVSQINKKIFYYGHCTTKEDGHEKECSY